jgi:2OG-Fe(II) oxygenase superfamily
MMSAVRDQRRSVQMERLHEAFPIFRTQCATWLPAGWVTELVECSAVHQETRYLSGNSVTSRQRQLGSAAEFVVGVVQGKLVASELPWLMEFYRGRVLRLANSLGLGTFVCSEDERSSINVNVLPVGSGYEWHVDSNPLTGLLAVSDHPAGTGGELVFRPDPLTRPDEDWELVVRPRTGDLLIFDARDAAHHVRPVLGPTERLTVPMNFYFADRRVVRPNDLDDYLYG